MCAVFLLLCLFFFPLKEIWAKDIQAPIKTGCLSCHGYKTTATFYKGISKSLYIDNDVFKASSHGKASCAECHEDYKDVPHKKERRKVDCTKECHIVENGVDTVYSHKEAAEAIAVSAHSRLDKDGKQKKYMDLIPGCTECHGFDHSSKKTATKKQKLHGVMSKDMVIKVCGDCHCRPEVVSRFNLSNVVVSYEETFHGKGHRFGRVDMPDCIDCHADPIKGPHLIRGRHSDKALITANCRTGDCHPGAGERLEGFHVHVSHDKNKFPVEYYITLFFRLLTTAVVYSLLAIVFLELLRRLFPGFTFFKE